MRLAGLTVLLASAVLVGACGGDDENGGPTGPRELEVASLGKDDDGEDIEPEEMAGQGDVLWMTVGSDVASADGKTGKLRTKPQEVPGNPILYDIAAGDAGVWVVTGDLGKTALVKVDEESGAPAEPVPLKLDSSNIPAGEGLEVAVGQGKVWASLTGTETVVAYDPSSGKQTEYDTLDPVEDIAADWAATEDSGEIERLSAPGSADTGLDGEDVVVHGEELWALTSDSVHRYDADGKQKNEISLGDVDAAVGTLAVGDTSAWALAYSDKKFVRIDVASNKADPKTFPLPEEPRDVAIAGGYAYVSANFEPLRRVRE
jgi:hypothetical protein